MEFFCYPAWKRMLQVTQLDHMAGEGQGRLVVQGLVTPFLKIHNVIQPHKTSNLEEERYIYHPKPDLHQERSCNLYICARFGTVCFGTGANFNIKNFGGTTEGSI